MSGYQHGGYAAALAASGTPRELAHSGGWLLESAISGTAERDGRGCYPFFACADWSQLDADLAQIEGLVSLCMVSDPFGAYDPAYLRDCFPDLMMPYKEHFVIDLQQPPSTIVKPHHARNVKKALQHVVVERCEQPLEQLDTWVALYANLVRRHQITGVAAFSRASFAAQLQVPGVVMFRARSGPDTVGMLLWYLQGEVGYYHLAAYSDAGYELRASYGLFDHAITYFTPHLRWLSLGAGAGTHSDASDGLTRFKQGWATTTRTVYLCGRIYNRERYAALVAARGVTGGGYFPLYRKGDVR